MRPNWRDAPNAAIAARGFAGSSDTLTSPAIFWTFITCTVDLSKTNNGYVLKLLQSTPITGPPQKIRIDRPEYFPLGTFPSFHLLGSKEVPTLVYLPCTYHFVGTKQSHSFLIPNVLV